VNAIWMLMSSRS